MTTMDSLLLKGLKYHGQHGYYKEEQEKGNDFEVDLIFTLNLRRAGKEDRLSSTINYEVAESVTCGIMEGEPVKLIETLALKIGDALFHSHPDVDSLEVRVRKLNPPLKNPAQYSEVRMRWPR